MRKIARLIHAAQPRPGMEAAAPDDTMNLEKEVMFIVQLADLSQLDRADSVEDQEQWGIKRKNGSVRVRSIDQARWELTTKLKTENRFVSEEITTVISQAQFDMFKALADNGMIKRRYCFNIPGTEAAWEFDVFFNADGSLFEWVKVDLELDPTMLEVPPFPVDVSRFINPAKTDLAQADREMVDKLFVEHFIVQPDAVQKNIA